MAMPKIAFLECSLCHHHLDASLPQTVCTECAGTLYVRYDLSAAAGLEQRGLVGNLEQDGRWSGMWRYRRVLPDVAPITLGEGWTPMLQSRRNANVWLKEEGANPTGTFKARGLALAVTMAHHYGLKKLAAPSAGNAGGALAAYAAAAGIEAHIFMPKDVPLANQVECMAYGAKLTLVDGLISDCGRIVAERKAAEGWFDVSTLKEPFRVEGKKTMGYELVEQLGWEYPDAVFYPTGGGVGMIGMWKAFEEMEQLGWVKGKRPKMIAIQAAGCAPVARAFDEGARQPDVGGCAHLRVRIEGAQAIRRRDHLADCARIGGDRPGVDRRSDFRFAQGLGCTRRDSSIAGRGCGDGGLRSPARNRISDRKRSGRALQHGFRQQIYGCDLGKA